MSEKTRLRLSNGCRESWVGAQCWSIKARNAWGTLSDVAMVWAITLEVLCA